MHTILQDSPIQNESQDEFGRVPLVELIANSIIGYSKESHPCTNIGLYGAWGSGKTSLINLLKKRLVANGEDDDIIIAQFNPWQAGSDEVLMVEFFKSIYKDFEGDVRYFIKKYGDVISFTAKAIPVVGEVLSSGIKTAKEALASSENTLKEQKERISKAIVDSGKHLFVFIDDLDRLDKEELHTVFRLIRQVADFDNTIYVVAMDVDMASKSISHYYGSSSEDGRRFIDKIIQVPISLPVISKSVLNGWLEKSMRAIIASQTNIEDGDLKSLVGKIIDLFETKRDCIRYINQLGFVFPSVVNEVNIHDFCLLEAIKVISQEAYLRILHNKKALLKILDDAGFPYFDDKAANDLLDKNFQNALDDIAKELTTHNIGVKIKNILEHDLFYYNSVDAFDLVDKQRLQSKVYFDKYFVLAVPDNLIPDVEMDKLKEVLFSMSHHDLSRWVDEKYQRFDYSEIQRATLRIIRKFDEDGRCKATKLFCEAFSVCELAKGYSPHLYNQKRSDVFVSTVLIPHYMVRSRETEMGMQSEVDANVLNETLSTIYQEAEFNYCMLIHYGVNKISASTTKNTAASFGILKNRFVSLSFVDQMKLHQELLSSFYVFWKRTDADGMATYLTDFIHQDDFQSEVFINKFIMYDGDATRIDSFINLFRDIVLLLVDKINDDGVDYGKDSSVRLFMANYKAVLGMA